MNLTRGIPVPQDDALRVIATRVEQAHERTPAFPLRSIIEKSADLACISCQDDLGYILDGGVHFVAVEYRVLAVIDDQGTGWAFPLCRECAADMSWSKAEALLAYEAAGRLGADLATLTAMPLAWGVAEVEDGEFYGWPHYDAARSVRDMKHLGSGTDYLVSEAGEA